MCDGPIVPIPLDPNVYSPGPDAFPLDPAGSVDTDGDGYPDELNDAFTSNSYPPLQEDLDDESFTYFVDQYGNIIGAEMFGLDLIREPKEQALALDAKNI